VTSVYTRESIPSEGDHHALQMSRLGLVEIPQVSTWIAISTTPDCWGWQLTAREGKTAY